MCLDVYVAMTNVSTRARDAHTRAHRSIGRAKQERDLLQVQIGSTWDDFKARVEKNQVPRYNECFAKYGMCMVCSFVPFRSREHDENTLRTAHPAVIFASHMCLVCGWVWVLDMNTRQQYMKPFYTGTLDINRSQTVPDPGTIGAVPDSIISTNTIHAHHPACKVLQLHLPCTNPAFMQMECIVKT